MKILNKILVSAFAISLMTSSAVAAPKSTDSDLIKIDGSSTVYPITEAVAEEFGTTSGNAKVTVGISGTGGGFKKFCKGETDISDASRPIKQKEIDLCEANGVKYVELPVAFDALSVVINPKNTWAKTMTVKELKKIWEPAAQNKIMRWNQIRPEWPNKKISLYGPGVDSGTYDYFTEAVVGKEHASRGDITSSEDDNVLVQGVANDEGALGFFGMAYYLENKDKLTAVGIDDEDEKNGVGPQLPSVANVEKGVYRPLSRPLFIYVSTKSLERPLIKSFITFYLKNTSELASEVGYVKLPEDISTLAKTRLSDLTTGSVFAGSGAKVGLSIADLMKQTSMKQKSAS